MAGQATPGVPMAGRRALAVGVLLATVAVAAGLRPGPEPAGAPARLVSAQPDHGARLAVPPTQLTVTFSGQLDPELTHVTAVTGAGDPVATGAAVVRGDTAVLPVEIRSGGYVLLGYHAVLRDGRQVRGEQWFVVGDAVDGSPPPAGLAGPPAGSHPHGEVGWFTGVVVLLITAGAISVLLVAFRQPRGR